MNQKKNRLNNLIMPLKCILVPFGIGIGLLIFFGLLAAPNIVTILLNIISNIVTIIAGIFGIYAFYLWRRQQVHAKQLDIFKNIYCYVLQVNDLIFDLYSPFRVNSFFEPSLDPTVKELSDEEIKSKIIQYRKNKFMEEQAITRLPYREQEIFNIYFPQLSNSLNKLIGKIESCIFNNMELELNPLKNHDDLNNEYIELIKSSFSNCLDPKFLKYKGKIIDEFESYKIHFENFYKKLINNEN